MNKAETLSVAVATPASGLYQPNGQHLSTSVLGLGGSAPGVANREPSQVCLCSPSLCRLSAKISPCTPMCASEAFLTCPWFTLAFADFGTFLTNVPLCCRS